VAVIAGVVAVVVAANRRSTNGVPPTSPTSSTSSPGVGVPTVGPAAVMIDPFNRVGRTVSLASSANAVAAGGGAVWVTDPVKGVVTRIDPTTGEIVATVPVS